MPKMLRPTTIIPPHLYVEREADRQLFAIAKDMGRPAYILVARQMGKTNLLLNMKRSLESEQTIVPYFDLSTRHESIRSLFRSLLDQILTSEHVRSDVYSHIINERSVLALEPNTEYDRHLRYILRAIGNKTITIILDEVDSLVNTVYSDGFFAQIRSMYFSRANFSEYDRLTYVLSGVAEPTDLIKDKAISPFNIGEKIYLDDFSRPEVDALVRQAKLALAPDIINEVFSWTAGNPRMTWDVLSELEDRLEQKAGLIKGDVFAAVEKLYLTRFDRAPVDHIRVLAESDPQVRNAIIAIRWNKGSALDEKARSRLYLAGVTSVNAGNAPRIKNRIIDAALSDAWLTQVAAAQKTLLEVAIEHFSAGRYEAAVTHFEEHEIQLGDGQTIKASDRWRLALARYHTGDLNAALADFIKVTESTISEDVLSSSRYYIGSIMIKLGEAEASLTHLRAAADTKGVWSAPSKIALQSAHMAIGGEGVLEQVIKLANDVRASVSTTNSDSIGSKGELISSSLFNVAVAHKAAGKNDIADKYIEMALLEAPPQLRPAIYCFQVRGETDLEAAGDVVEKAANEILSSRLSFASGFVSALSFSETVLATVMMWLSQTKRNIGLEKLLSYAVEVIYSHSRQPFDVLLHLSQVGTEDTSRYVPLLNLGLKSYDDDSVTPKHRLSALRTVARYASDQDQENGIHAYRQALTAARKWQQDLDLDEVFTLTALAQQKQRLQQSAAGLELIEFGLSLFGDAGGPDRLARLLLLNGALGIFASARRFKEARVVANEIIRDSDGDMPGAAGYDHREIEIALNTIRENALRFRPAAQSLDPYRHIGRNERIRVKDLGSGKILTDKFKKFEDHLRTGKYSLVLSRSDRSRSTGSDEDSIH